MRWIILTSMVAILSMASSSMAETPNDIKGRVISASGLQAALQTSREGNLTELNNALLAGGSVQWEYIENTLVLHVRKLDGGEGIYKLNQNDTKKFEGLFTDNLCANSNAPLLEKNFENFKKMCESKRNVESIKDQIKKENAASDKMQLQATAEWVKSDHKGYYTDINGIKQNLLKLVSYPASTIKIDGKNIMVTDNKARTYRFLLSDNDQNHRDKLYNSLFCKSEYMAFHPDLTPICYK